LLSINGERRGGGAVPGIYWAVGKRNRLLMESARYYG